MSKEIIGLIAIILLLQFALSVLHPSLHLISKCALSMLVMLSAFSIILTAIDKYEMPEIDYGQMEDDRYSEALTDACEQGIRLEVADKYKIEEDKIFVSLYGFDVSKMRAERIYLRIEDFHADYRSIRSFVAEHFLLDGGDIEVELTKQ